MATITKCDLCKETIPALSYRWTRDDRQTRGEVYDLCSGCNENLVTAFKSKLSSRIEVEFKWTDDTDNTR